jgi:cytochrome P450
MTTTPADVEYDPYDPATSADPFPVFRRLRDDVPLYYNEQLDFFALSRFDDVERTFADRRTYINGRGDVLEAIQSNMPVPPGFFIFEDSPLHTAHRGVLSRSFTPRRIGGLEPEIRRFCAEALDPFVGADQIDFVRDLGAQIPMRVISKLLGIPEADQETVRDRADEHVRTEPGKPRDYAVQTVTGEEFAEYVDWRVDHPSDDMMTELINAEFEDETGTVRSLTRQEVLVYTNLLASAGNETTNRLIGWMAKVLSDHPDQRRLLLDEPALIANTVEETLRYEPTGLHIARYVARDVDLYDRVVPQGSAMLLLAGAANRDERHFPDADRFDVRRRIDRHFTFAYGAHFCLGAALARLEGRVALEEVLKRFPDWEVDLDQAKFAATSTVRGWETLPAVIR